MTLFYAVSVIVALAVGALVVWLIKSGVSVRWWEWLMGVIGVILIIVTLQHVFATFVENQPAALWPGVLTFGVPAIILLAIAGQFIARRQRVV